MSADAQVAFVIMPFTPMSDLVYRALIHPLVEKAGYRARRADTTLNQRAIMQDVIEGIQGASLVIADLTGRNPNVFYELGLAHVLDRPTLLLAQATADIPFDLAAYRTVIYSIEFPASAGVRSSMATELPAVLEAARDGSLVFSNPFKDFSRQGVETDPTPEHGEGILDRFARFIDVDVPAATAAIQAIGAEIIRATAEQKQITEAGADDESLASKLAMAARLGVAWNQSADRLEPIVDEQLVPSMLQMERVTAALQRARDLGATDTEQFAEAIRGAAAQSADFAAMVAGTAGLIRENAHWASSLTQPGRRLAGVYDRMAVNARRLAAAAEILS